MEKIKNFIATIFIGGLVVILPIAILVNVFQWLLGWLTGMIEPLTGLIIATTQTNQFFAEVVGLISIVLGCFLIGLFVKTAGGKWLHNQIERWFFEWIPGYEMLKELFEQLQPSKKRAFSKPVLVTLDEHKNYFLGYITDEYEDDRYAVFIPTSPSPMNGFVIQTHAKYIKFLAVASDKLMKTVVGCGVGSAEIMAKVKV